MFILITFFYDLVITITTTFSIRAGSAGNLCVSVRDYYCYKFQMCPGIFNPIFYGKRLFQQFAVDTYVIESSRLDYIRNNQDSLRADLYQGLVDSLNAGEGQGNVLEDILFFLRRSSEVLVT